MKKFKLLLTLALALVCFKGASAMDMRIWERGVSEPILVLNMNDDPKVVFEGDSMRVSTYMVEISTYLIDSIEKFTYYEPGVGVNDVYEAAPKFSFDGDEITVTAAKAGGVVTVYNASGMQVAQKTMATGGSCTLSLGNAAGGFYVVNVNGRTYKIVKR